jgi:hypothetical protein
MKYEGRHSTLSDEREALLNEVCFIWDSHKQIWNEHFEELVKFFTTHGHCNVFSTGNAQLSTWCKHQRQQYKKYMNGMKSTMDNERICRLESIGFDWNPRNISSLFE